MASSEMLQRVAVVKTDVSEELSASVMRVKRICELETTRMVSSGLLRRVALVRTDVSEEPGASLIRVTKFCELGTTQAAPSTRITYFFAATDACEEQRVLFLVHRLWSP
jgi:hypothetical protein